MGTRDAGVDAYIARQAGFARPILARLRATVHDACPDAVETLKWGMPSFLYHGILCGMAGFKRHCALWFRQPELAALERRRGEAMGQFGRITALAELPAKRVLTGYVKRAMALNAASAASRAAGRTPPRPKPARRPMPRVPADLRSAWADAAAARATWGRLAPSHRREYLEWILGAKRPGTRARRIATAVRWLTAGKPFGWRHLEHTGRRARR